MTYVVCITAADGTRNVVGPFKDELLATLYAYEQEAAEEGVLADVQPLGTP